MSSTRREESLCGIRQRNPSDFLKSSVLGVVAETINDKTRIRQ